jgi:hypothetical protein
MKTPFLAWKQVRVILFGATPLLLALTLGNVRGCNVPVFYFALFEWQSNPHALVLGTLPTGTSETSIKDHLAHSSSNLVLDTATEPIPAGHVQIRFPKTNRLWWDAPLPGVDPKKGLDLLLDSPVRQNIVRQLEAGVSVVWVLLDSGDKKADEAAYAQLTKRLEYLGKVVSLPAADNGNESNEGPDLTNTRVPLKIAFSVIKVSRNDPKEVGLVAQLLNVFPDLLSVKSPIAYPVFGRGLVMAPIYGIKLNEVHIDSWTEFAVGACSCTVKAQNPGIELLVSADWDNFLGATPDHDSTAPGIDQPNQLAPPNGESQLKIK